MSTNQRTLLRQWHMLRMIPRHPGKITAKQLCLKLSKDEFDVTERTVQRDLQELSEVFPLIADEREKPFGWSWQKDAPSFDLPGLDISNALTLILVERHLQNFLPPSTLEHLRPYFRAAAKRLDDVRSDSGMRSWMGKVRSVPPQQRLLPPQTDNRVQHVVYDGLLHDRKLRLQYRKRGEKKSVEYEVHPLAIVQRGAVLYLICTFFDYSDIRMLALHRIVSAETMADPSVRPKGFSVDGVIASGIMGFGGEQKIVLEALFTAKGGAHLFETPLGKDQRLEELPDGRLKLTVSVVDTNELRWWLLGLGPAVEVVSPPELRQAISNSVMATAALYKNQVTTA